MRTTVSIDDHLLSEAKRRAHAAGVPLGRIVDDALRDHLQRPDPEGERPPIPVFPGTGVHPGVDLTSTRALTELLDTDRPLDKLR